MSCCRLDDSEPSEASTPRPDLWASCTLEVDVFKNKLDFRFDSQWNHIDDNSSALAGFCFLSSRLPVGLLPGLYPHSHIQETSSNKATFLTLRVWQGKRCVYTGGGPVRPAG